MKKITRKEYISILTISVIFMVVAFICIIIAGSVEMGIWNNVLGISFFVFMMIALMVLAFNYSKISIYEKEKKIKAIEENDCLIIENFTYSRIKEGFTKQKYQYIDNHFYYKRMGDINNDFINYYFQLINDNDFHNFMREFEYFDSKKYKNNHKNIVLCYFINNVNNQDLIEYKEVCKKLVLPETTYKYIGTCYFIFLIDNFNKKLYYVKDINHLSRYSQTVRILKKLIR